jgi:hypothetical protein
MYFKFNDRVEAILERLFPVPSCQETSVKIRLYDLKWYIYTNEVYHKHGYH